MQAIFYLISCRLRSRLVYSLVSVFIVAVCTAVLLVALSLSNGFEVSILDKLIIAAPHVSVFSDGNFTDQSINDAVKRKLRIVQTQGLAINLQDNTVQGVLLRGTFKDRLKDLLDRPDILQSGKMPGAGELITGHRLAESLKINIGDKVRILTGPAVFEDFKVSGIFKVGLYDYDSTVMLAPYENIIALTPDESEGMASKVSLFTSYWLKDPFKARLFAENIAVNHPEAFVSNWQDDNNALVSAIALEKKVIFVVLFLLVVAVSVAIANSQFIQVIMQHKQIANLLAMGFTPVKILLVFIFEALVIAVGGAGIGFLISIAAVFYLQHYPIALPTDVYQVDNLPVVFEYSDAVITVCAMTVMVVLSSFVPAVYAARLNPVEILRRI